MSGFKKDKDYRRLIAGVSPFVQQVYACEPPDEVAVDRADVVACAESFGLPAQAFPTVDDAMAAATREKRPGEFVLVAGSLFLVAAARRWLLARKGQSA